jgi:uroporphyrin-III C-methyltransferase/precorrin-2 dehydrogenase/sirohydrochlorin ferrochelatase
MKYLPICLKLENRPVLLIGGGKVAYRKSILLQRAGALIDVIAPNIDSDLLQAIDGQGRWIEQPWSSAVDLTGYAAIIAATPNEEVNAEVSQRAHDVNIPVNVVDNPSLCSFILPAIVDRDPLLITVSSSGDSPVLARRIRRELESQYPARLGEVAAFLGSQRQRVGALLPDIDERRTFWEYLLDDTEWMEAVLGGNRTRAESIYKSALDEQASAGKRGAVYLIGAGPGDPDLMTFKALRLLQRADVVLYDRLVGPGILELARRDAEKVYVGKQRAEHAVPQSEINAELLKLAQSGKRVARLKGGDPFIFGRGGEEIADLMAAGIDFEVVPGITAASGAACYGGIPLTHRDYAQSVRFITGHTKNHELNLPWQQYLNPAETLVFYMGLAGMSIIVNALMAAGREADTPVAIVERATLPDQRVLTGTLASIEGVAAKAKPQAPTLLIIGDVVKLHPSLGWFAST